MKTNSLSFKLVAGILAIWGIYHGSSLGAETVTANWNRWCGPTGNNVTPESSGWNGSQWPLKKLWQKKVGSGPSSPLIVGGRAYVMGWKDNTDYIRCLDLGSGDVVWEQIYSSPKWGRLSSDGAHGYWQGGPLATPAMDETTGLLYTLSCDGLLACWDTKNKGARKWSVNIIEEHNIDRRKDARNDYWGDVPEDEGIVCSPLILGGRVLIESGSDSEGELMAYNKMTGECEWKSQYKDDAGHSSPAAMKVEGKDCVAHLALNNFVVTRADDGHAGEKIGEVVCNGHAGHNIVTPVVANGNQVLFTCGFNVNKMWLVEAGLSELKLKWVTSGLVYSRICTPAVYKGRIYGLIVSGLTVQKVDVAPAEKLRCLDLASGKQKWEGPGRNDGIWEGTSLVVMAGDDKLIVRNGKELRLVDIGSGIDQYKELARAATLVGGWCQLAVGNGCILTKDDFGEMECYRLEGVSQAAPKK
jgi:hypothetical protein